MMGSMAFCISGGKQYRQQRAAFWVGLCICRQHCAVNGINVRKIILCLLLPQFAVRHLSTLTVNDFYRSLADKPGLQPSFRKPDNFKSIQEEISRLAMEKRRTPVFIIDEANYVSNAILNDLKILFNFEMDSKDRAVILLVGLPQLNSTLRLGVHEPLRQRIIMNYNMEGLYKDEGRTYISEKLKGAGGTPGIFEENAVEAVLNAADGTPRMINKLCNASMLIAASREFNCVNADAVMQAVSDCELG